jgi:uncharacterized protein with HEPN domain
MDNEIKKLLKDIHICINAVNSYTGFKKVFSEYNSDFLLQDAVERNLITIGEAMNLLLKKAPDISISNARKIVNTRNRLTHGYDEIDNTQIWNIIINYLPTLKTEVERLLEENV